MDYKQQTILFDGDDLDELNEQIEGFNEEGWQVHTFNSVPVVGVHGVASVHHFVVMTLTYLDDPDEQEQEPEGEGHSAENDEVVVPMRMTGSR